MVYRFTPDEEASEALERVAEDGFSIRLVDAMDTSLAEELVADDSMTASGYLMSLEGGLPELGSGESTTFYLNVSEGEALSFATMFVPSDDAFFAPGKECISLFGDGSPVSGDVTDQLTLWDAGTEENQPPGTGEDTKPQQPPTAIDVGPDEDGRVQPIEEVDDEFEYPAVSDVISVTIEPQ